MSFDDIYKFVLHEGKEFRACNPSDLTYSIRIGDGAYDTAIIDDYAKALSQIRDEAGSYAKINSNSAEEFKIMRDNRIKEKANEWLYINTSKYGYIYSIERKGV